MAKQPSPPNGEQPHEAADIREKRHAARPPAANPAPPVYLPSPAVLAHHGEPAPYALVKVFFGTDRQVIGSTAPTTAFGAQRSSLVSYGEVDVSIPRDHRQGALESPSLWRMRFRVDPNKDVMVLHTSVMTKEAFAAALRTEVKASSKPSLLIFVHGYNVSFTDAARRTAQIAYDLAFPGVAVFFSWPSQDQFVDYTVDEQSIEWAQPHLEQFLHDLLSQSDADRVYLIAHSMGNRALTRTLVSLAAKDPTIVRRIKEVILAAPDIDADVFVEQIAPGLAQLGAPVTLYASSNDRALMASKQVHGGARAGEAGDRLVVCQGIETVDASNTDTGLIGHSYFGDRRSVLADMFYVVRNDVRAAQRYGLRALTLKNQTYWLIEK
ncbi:alpha/beta fold hydrolase [Cupriavidus sp. WKF15]|uniref:alpha/beta hydrolase n=1 Tax=Cupriavidus sp. WKF15 TaxID=3032282 RepID=UPI0023E200B0|nr:alpha/beta fold hydrolase [Cupriavidus sp. WKF15]WER48610.1 alpha/beta fold hydrolase [Cupriavidus sp. WKF15]